MAKKNKGVVMPQMGEYSPEPAEKERRASVRPVVAGKNGGPIPIMPVASNVQLTPIVQPVAFVPYNTQKQPLLTYDGEWEEEEIQAEEDAYEDAYDYAPSAFGSVSVATSKKRVSVVALVLILLGIVVAALYIIAKFVAPVSEYLALTVSEGAYISGYGCFEMLIANIKDGIILDMANLIPFAVCLSAFFTLLTIITCLIRICRKGAAVFAKITVFFALACALVTVVYPLINKADVAIGAYILCGLQLIALIVAYLGKKEPRVRA